MNQVPEQKEPSRTMITGQCHESEHTISLEWSQELAQTFDYFIRAGLQQADIHGTIPIGIMAGLKNGEKVFYLACEGDTAEILAQRKMKNLPFHWSPPFSYVEQCLLEEQWLRNRLQKLKERLIHIAEDERFTLVKSLEKQYEQERKQLQKLHDKQKSTRKSTSQDSEQKMGNVDAEQKRKHKMDWNARINEVKEPILPLFREVTNIKKERKNLTNHLKEVLLHLYAINQENMMEPRPRGKFHVSCDHWILKFASTIAREKLSSVVVYGGTWSTDKNRFQEANVHSLSERFGNVIAFLQSGGLQRYNKHKVTNPQQKICNIYEDDYVLVVEKPAGLLSVPGRSSKHQDSLLSRLMFRTGSREELHTIHRLDQATSGLMMLAKSKESKAAFSKLFQERNIVKIYQAIINTRVESKSGLISIPMGPHVSEKLLQSPTSNRAKQAETGFEVVEQKTNKTRVRFYPITGRTHQLRVHSLHFFGAPILGDNLYGNAHNRRLHLHAEELHFVHPYTKQRCSFVSLCPF